MTQNDTSTANSFQELIKRFWGFDHLIGSALIKVIYYIGLVIILLITVMGMLRGGNYNSWFFIMSPLIGATLLVFWRFICELWLLMFLMYNRMGEIRDRLPPQ